MYNNKKENEVKKILIIMPYFECGGVESTLLSLFDIMDTEKYEITLILLEKKGKFLNRIPKNIIIKEIVIPEREKGIFYGKKKVLLSYLKHGKIYKVFNSLEYYRDHSLTEDRKNNAQYFREISSTIPELEGEYDLAIDYFGYASFTTFYLAEKVKARKKVTWLHSILSRFHPEEFKEWYEKMDCIFACSQMVKRDFEEIFPTIKTVKLFYNIIDPIKIREKAEDQGGFDDVFNGTRILTVGRICHEKGIDLAVEAFKNLVSNGYNVRWYIIGGGSTQDIENVKKHLVTETEKSNFIFLGVKNNPYVYMKQCDIYVQPSRFEGYCTTTNEARIIGCPIVMTNVSGSDEQIENRKTGLIVRSNWKDIYMGVLELLINPELKHKFVLNLKGMNYNTCCEVEKIYELLRRQTLENSNEKNYYS